MAKISTIKLAKTGVQYDLEDSAAIHTSYFEAKVLELQGIITELERRLKAVEYEVSITDNNSSNESTNS